MFLYFQIKQIHHSFIIFSYLQYCNQFIENTTNLRRCKMWNEPSREQLEKIPNLYQTETTRPKDKLIYLHFFIGGCDWYIAEYDGDDLFWGFAILNGDYMNAEWGYISYSELKEIKVHGIEIDNDLYWEVCKASEVDKIKKSNFFW